MRMQICFDLSCLFSDVSVVFAFYVCSAVFFSFLCNHGQERGKFNLKGVIGEQRLALDFPRMFLGFWVLLWRD